MPAGRAPSSTASPAITCWGCAPSPAAAAETAPAAPPPKGAPATPPLRPPGPADALPPDPRALLMVEADGAVEDLPRQIAALKQALGGAGLLEIRSGFERDAIAQLWAARKSLSHAVKQIAPLKINEDVVVPVSQLADLVA